MVAIDVKPLLRGEVKNIPIDEPITMDQISGVTFPEDARAVGGISDNGGYMRLTLTVKVPYVAECARCLDPVPGEFCEEFERTVVAKGSVAQEKIEESVDEYAVLDEEGMLDIRDELVETMLLLFPKKILCSEDCPGLCPKCGKPLRDGDCGCPKKEIDPRWAILQKYLDKPEN